MIVRNFVLGLLFVGNSAFAVNGINSGFFASGSTHAQKRDQWEEEIRREQEWVKVQDRLREMYGDDTIIIKNAKDYNDCIRENNKQYDNDMTRCDRRQANERSDCEDRAERGRNKGKDSCERIGHSDNLRDAVNDKKDKGDCEGGTCSAGD